jgi:hypothetical protein
MTDQTPEQPAPEVPEETAVPIPTPAASSVPAPERHRPGLGHIVFGAALILVGAGWLAETLGAANVPWRILLPSMLVLVGLALVVGARTGHHPGLIALGAVLVVSMLLVAVFEVMLDIPLAEGVGKETNRVVGVAQPEYRWGVGSMILDLTAAGLPPGGTVEASVAIGELVVVVPQGVAVEVSARSGLGDVSVFGQHHSGLGARLDYADPPASVPKLRLLTEVAIGKVEVRR